MLRRWRSWVTWLTTWAPVGVSALLMALGAAVGIGVAHWMHVRQIGAVNNLEVLDFLQVAANVADGKGLRTFVLRPLAMTAQTPMAPMTDLYHPPLPLLVWGAVFAALGQATERYAAYLAGALMGLTATLAGLLAARLTNRWGGVVAAGLVFATPVALLVSGLGHPAALAACLFTLWVTVATLRSPWTGRFAVLSGALLGGAAMAQGLALAAVPVALLSRRWQPAKARWLFALTLLVILLPVAVRNWRWAGHPFTPQKVYAFLLDTRAFPGDTIYRHTFEQSPSALQLTLHHLPDILRKSRINLQRLPQVGASWGWWLVIGVLFSWVLWRRWATLGQRLPVALMLTLLPTVVAVLLFTRVDATVTTFFAPLASVLTVMVALAAVEWVVARPLWQRLTRVPVQRTLVPSACSLLVGLMVLSGQGLAAVRLMQSLVPDRFNVAGQSALFGARFIPSKGVLATDEPRWFAFYWRRPVVWLPCHLTDWRRLGLDRKVTHFWVSPSALLQVGGETDRALRLALVAGRPFMNRFYPVALRAQQMIAMTPFLIAAPKPLRDGRQPVQNSATHQPVSALLKDIDRALQKKDFARAERLALAAVQQHPHAGTFFALGNVWLLRERWLEAARAFQAALGEAPGFFAAANNLAWVYLQIAERLARQPGNDWQATLFLRQADRWANYALERAPNDPLVLAHILDTAGWVDFLLGRTSGNRSAVRWRLNRALQRLQRACALLPDNAEINYHLGMVYTELGRVDLAQRYLSKAGKKQGEPQPSEGRAPTRP
ncbi:hypothetical protein HRbin17_00536 [bacterium HR17]|uniref:Glycosyltransferase RgtA/B/C/D-like domain-containing protein n=1 Tax=Candidatus Fervidibacter japonicus TaxID=2035412 RepID=A0A2H5XA22_9BACT|nr:hypothetical protein HRbin17_00536 [bacterium HR17]